jgi:hypothetical protein
VCWPGPGPGPGGNGRAHGDRAPAHSQRGQLAVQLDDDLEAVLIADGGASPIDPAELDGALRPEPGRPVNYAFRYESPPSDLRLRLSAAPSRASAEVTTVVSVREGEVATISQGGLPDPASGALAFSSGNAGLAW